MVTPATTTPNSNTDDDATLADTAGRRLARFVGRGRLALRLPDAGSADADDMLVLPAIAVERLVQLLGTLAAEPLDSPEVGLTGLAVAPEVWPADDFSDWEAADE